MAKLEAVKVTSAGQISIPKCFRGGFCEAGDLLSIEPYADGLLLRRLKPFQESTPIDDTNLKKKISMTPSDPGHSIDWEMDEPVSDFLIEARDTCAACVDDRADDVADNTADDATDIRANDDADDRADDAMDDRANDGEKEETAKMRKEMWKALLDSRAL